MKKINKYILDHNIADEFKFKFNQGSKFLSLKIQRNLICVWIEENFPEEDEIVVMNIKFSLLPTGWTVPERLDGKFIDTAVLDGGNLILHIYGEVL